MVEFQINENLEVIHLLISFKKLPPPLYISIKSNITSLIIMIAIPDLLYGYYQIKLIHYHYITDSISKWKQKSLIGK